MAKDLPLGLNMNFSDMLKNRKKNTEEETLTETGQTGKEPENKEQTESKETTPTEAQTSAVETESSAATPSDNKEGTVGSEEKLRAELSEANDKYVRLYAEFDNFKRRTSRERIEFLQTAGKEVLQSLLPVMDDFERALKSLENNPDITSVKEGLTLVYNKFKNTLSQKGLKQMESIGTVFDADLHEAITNIPAPTDDMKGKVIDEVEKGYYLNDKVIRFAKVVVGS